VRGDRLPKHGVLANHALRRAYATAATNAGVDEDTVGKLLNHGGRSVTSRYIVNGPRNLPSLGPAIFPTLAGLVISRLSDRYLRF
jgi:site-specific recombinase XerD